MMQICIMIYLLCKYCILLHTIIHEHGMEQYFLITYEYLFSANSIENLLEISNSKVGIHTTANKNYLRLEPAEKKINVL